MAISDTELEAITSAIVTVAKEQLAAALTPLTDRVATLEARPVVGVAYAGTHAHLKAYPAGVLVTKKGGLWLSLRQTNGTPGMDPESWKLIVKSGHAEADR